MKKIGLYIHIPFCKRKCFYCDFNSYSNKNCLIDKYVGAVIQEIKGYNLEKYEIETVYIGGGTPSYIDGRHIESILKNIDMKKSKEVTIEVNPRDCDI